MHPESENNLISGVFTLRVPVPGIPFKPALNDTITTARGYMHRMVGLKGAFPAIYRKTGAAEQMPFLRLWQSGPGDVFLSGWIRQPALFRRNIFLSAGARGISAQNFSTMYGDFSPFFGNPHAAAERPGGSLYCFLEGCLEKIASHRTVKGSFFSFSIPYFSRLFLSKIITAWIGGIQKFNFPFYRYHLMTMKLLIQLLRTSLYSGILRVCVTDHQFLFRHIWFEKFENNELPV